jgi:hypothetical protein
MRMRWKLLGLAGAAGVAATGAVVAAHQRREQHEYSPEELRDKLHERLGDNGAGPATEAGETVRSD